MAQQPTKSTTEASSLRLQRFQEVKSKYVGAEGTPERNQYETELRAEIIAEKIKALRLSRNMTQEELGEKLGVKKAQISRLESATANITLETLQRVFLALGARVTFEIELLK